ncbi:hypothetical protein FGRMN_3195 [Fusarium graminum]|nr:hypothetical protein FGRMN_3195 [Fusarium graminum]
MSQVKNLRAMFENKGDTSPPERGRSSGASTPVQVRTSFVAIEKDGRIGLQRNPSHESSVSRRRLSMDTDAESVSTVPDKPSASLEEAPRGNKPFFQEPIPESPRLPVDPPKTPTEQIGAVTDEPSVNPDKQVDQEESSPSLLPVEPAPVSPTKEETPMTPSAATNGKSETATVEEPAPPATSKTTEPAKIATPAQAATPAKTTTAKKTTTIRPSTISTKPVTTKPPTKSPCTAKPSPVTRPSASTTHKPETKPTLKASPVIKKEPKPAARTTSTATRPQAATTSKKPQPLKPTTSDTGFVKPKPKSPTRPVHLPASLTAPTAASGARTGRQGRPPASSQNLGVPARPASRASSTGAGASVGKAAKRQPSTSNVSRSRPSLGVPPKKAVDQSQTKKEAPVDESFLARMMRPTQASSSKTAEKVPTTPPRKTTKRRTSSGAGATRRESSVKAPGSARKPIRKMAESKPTSGSVVSDDSHSVESADERKASETAKSETSEVPVITTEEAQTDGPSEDSKMSEPEPVIAEESVPEEPVEEARPATPKPSNDETKPVETTMAKKSEASTEKSVASDSEKPTTNSKEPAADSEQPAENADIIPLMEESSAQAPVVIEETNETTASEPKLQNEDEIIPLLEKDTEPATEIETADTKVDTATKHDTKEDAKATDASGEDTTGEETIEQEQESESATKTD